MSLKFAECYILLLEGFERMCRIADGAPFHGTSLNRDWPSNPMQPNQHLSF